MSIRIIIYNVAFHLSFFKSDQIRNTQVVFLCFREISNGPISSKFPIPVDDCPGPPYKIINGISYVMLIGKCSLSFCFVKNPVILMPYYSLSYLKPHDKRGIVNSSRGRGLVQPVKHPGSRADCYVIPLFFPIFGCRCTY